MFRVRNENLAVTLEAFSAAPIPFDAAALRAAAESALAQFSEYGLRPTQIVQRLGDQLFDYELSFSLFNNQAHVRFGSERIVVNVQNARGQRDVQLIKDSLFRAVQCMKNAEIKRFSLQSTAHAAFDSEISWKTFFDPFADQSQGILGGGRISAVQEPSWQSSVRFTFEKSLLSKDGVFLAWSTEQPEGVSLESLQETANRFGVAAQKHGLEIWFE